MARLAGKVDRAANSSNLYRSREGQVERVMIAMRLLCEDGNLQPHDREEKGRNYVPTSPPLYCSPGGGLFSTATDYGKFLQMILAGGQFGDQRLLQPDTVVLMTELDQVFQTVFPLRG